MMRKNRLGAKQLITKLRQREVLQSKSKSVPAAWNEATPRNRPFVKAGCDPLRAAGRRAADRARHARTRRPPRKHA